MRREQVLTRELWLLLVGLVFLFLNTTLLVPVLPAVVARTGGSSGAGLVTACFYFPAVATQLRMPRAMRRYTTRGLLVCAFALLGLPCLAYASDRSAVTLVLVATAVRGVGFGCATVASGTLIAELAPAHRRGTVIGYAGLASGIPPVFAPSAGLWLFHNEGAIVVFVIAGAMGLAGSLTSLFLEPRPTSERRRSSVYLFRASREQALISPFVWFLLVSLTRGAVLSFASLWFVRAGLSSAASFLLAFGTLAYLARWLGGKFADRKGPRMLMVPGALASLGGLVLLASGDGPARVVLSSGILFGAGYGLLQSASQLDMLARSGSGNFAVATTAWNIAIDCGVGLGGVLIGLTAALSGYGTAFWLLPGVMGAALVVMLIDRGPPTAARARPGSVPSD